MSLKKIEQIKDNKPFKILDLVIYMAVLLSAAALFVAFYFTRERGELTGICVYYNSVEIFTYDFENDEYKISDESHIVNITDSAEALSLRFVVNADNTESDYNDIYIDKTAVSVTVTQADCSSHKDCCYMSDITNDSMEIYCTPHKLRITAVDFKPSGTDIIL